MEVRSSRIGYIFIPYPSTFVSIDEEMTIQMRDSLTSSIGARQDDFKPLHVIDIVHSSIVA